MNAKFTILGATGFVGSRLRKSLERKGVSCFSPARGDGLVFSQPLGHVIYCAGYTADFREHPLETAEAHVGFLVDVLTKASFDSLLYLSSTRVYEGAASTREDADLKVNPANPNHIFNITKLAGEACCLSQASRKVRIARLSNVLGDDFQSDNFLYSVMRDLIRTGKVTLRTSRDSTKDYIVLADVLELLPKIAEHGKEKIYNLASGNNFDNGSLLARMAEIGGGEVSFQAGAAKVAFPEIDVSRLRSEFGFMPRSVAGELEGVYRAFREYLSKA